VPVFRGNAGTRLGKSNRVNWTRCCWPSAGWPGSGRLDAVTQIFEPGRDAAAPGQGALAVEMPAGDPDLAALLAQVDERGSAGLRDRGTGVLADWPPAAARR